MSQDSDGLAEVIAFPGKGKAVTSGKGGGKTAKGTSAAEPRAAKRPSPESKVTALRSLREQITATENEYAPNPAAAPKPEAHNPEAPNPAALSSEAPKSRRSTSKSASPVQFVPKGEASADQGESHPDPADEQARASDLLVKALARSPKSIREAEQFLIARAELDARQREQVVHRMIDLGYLDDHRLAEQLCNGSLQRKGLGKVGIGRELRKRGIEDAAIEDALEGFESDDEFERALELAEQRFSRLRGLDSETARRRLYGYLSRRGYSGDIVSRAVREVLG